jgi:hypothetical protein
MIAIHYWMHSQNPTIAMMQSIINLKFKKKLSQVQQPPPRRRKQQNQPEEL